MRIARVHLLLLSSALVPACAIPGDAAWSDTHVSAYAAGFALSLEVDSSNLSVPASGAVGALSGAFSVNSERSYTTQYGVRIGFAHFEVSISRFNNNTTQDGVISGNGGFFLGEALVGDLKVDSTFDIDSTKIILGVDILNTSLGRVAVLGGLDLFNFNQFKFAAQEANGANIVAGSFQNVLVNQGVPVPIIGVRADIYIPDTDLRVGAEMMGVSVSIDEIDGVDAVFIDYDFNLNFEIFTNGEAVIGYRSIDLSIDGSIDNILINMDLNMSGPYFGVALYF
ncbi:MAG: hypothetical protein ACI84O_001143 [Myxococcota bacterium]|jgi:hypothetical protein